MWQDLRLLVEQRMGSAHMVFDYLSLNVLCKWTPKSTFDFVVWVTHASFGPSVPKFDKDHWLWVRKGNKES